eukprot:TRINITY_DN12328_c0_g1_i1.p1 TRINITY_DN12328_c0_g1~~TRINITY_DN12328_c0_g1_i1.p1  ORF type:complete len:316 (+),score=91.02 TRINITY_DN12328_c0_g1_i1:115-1062(+)
MALQSSHVLAAAAPLRAEALGDKENLSVPQNGIVDINTVIEKLDARVADGSSDPFRSPECRWKRAKSRSFDFFDSEKLQLLAPRPSEAKRKAMRKRCRAWSSPEEEEIDSNELASILKGLSLGTQQPAAKRHRSSSLREASPEGLTVSLFGPLQVATVHEIWQEEDEAMVEEAAPSLLPAGAAAMSEALEALPTKATPLCPQTPVCRRRTLRTRLFCASSPGSRCADGILEDASESALRIPQSACASSTRLAALQDGAASRSRRKAFGGSSVLSDFPPSPLSGCEALDEAREYLLQRQPPRRVTMDAPRHLVFDD